jgi:hypothetical protein
MRPSGRAAGTAGVLGVRAPIRRCDDGPRASEDCEGCGGEVGGESSGEPPPGESGRLVGTADGAGRAGVAAFPPSPSAQGGGPAVVVALAAVGGAERPRRSAHSDVAPCRRSCTFCITRARSMSAKNSVGRIKLASSSSSVSRIATPPTTWCTDTAPHAHRHQPRAAVPVPAHVKPRAAGAQQHARAPARSA